MLDDKLMGLLNALGESMGLADLQWDAHEECHLAIGDELTLLLRHSSEEERITLASVVANEVPDPLDHALAIELLEHALHPMAHAGPAVGLDRDSDFLLAYCLISTAHLEPTVFVEKTMAFLEYAFHMRRRIAGEHAQAQMPESITNGLQLGQMV